MAKTSKQWIPAAAQQVPHKMQAHLKVVRDRHALVCASAVRIQVHERVRHLVLANTTFVVKNTTAHVIEKECR